MQSLRTPVEKCIALVKAAAVFIISFYVNMETKQRNDTHSDLLVNMVMQAGLGCLIERII